MDASYRTRYRDLYTRHWWWRAREHVIVETLRRRRPAGRWSAALDVGCGDGLFFDRLGEFAREVEGVEPAADLVNREARRAGAIHIAPFDARFRPGRRYGVILMLDVLEHLEDAEAALRHVVELLEPGGTFVATVPAFNALWTSHDDVNHHYTRYTRRSFGAVARRVGLRVEHARYFFQWTCPAKLAVRATEAVFRRPPRPAAVPPAWVNASLYWLSRAEAATVGRLAPPFGSSLLVVGERGEG